MKKDRYIVEVWCDGRVVKVKLVCRPQKFLDSNGGRSTTKNRDFLIIERHKIGLHTGTLENNILVLPPSIREVLSYTYSSRRRAKETIFLIQKAIIDLNCGKNGTIISSK